MSLSLVQRIRCQGIAVHLCPDGSTIELYGPDRSYQTWLSMYGGGLLQELRAERETGKRLAQAILAEPVEPCEHVYEMIFGPTYDKAVMACGKCGGPA